LDFPHKKNNNAVFYHQWAWNQCFLPSLNV
jgi:hypothetical protein